MRTSIPLFNWHEKERPLSPPPTRDVYSRPIRCVARSEPSDVVFFLHLCSFHVVIQVARSLTGGVILRSPRLSASGSTRPRVTVRIASRSAVASSVIWSPATDISGISPPVHTVPTVAVRAWRTDGRRRVRLLQPLPSPPLATVHDGFTS